MSVHAFLSYVREDTERVDRLQRQLELGGIPVWRDSDALWPGDRWRVKLREAIHDQALAFVPCFSEHSEARSSSTFFEEISWAADEYRRRHPDIPWLFPVLFDECSIPTFDLGQSQTLDDLQWTRLFENWKREADRLAQRLQEVFQGRRTFSLEVRAALEAGGYHVASSHKVVTPDGHVGRWEHAVHTPVGWIGVATLPALPSRPADAVVDIAGQLEPGLVAGALVVVNIPGRLADSTARLRTGFSNHLRSRSRPEPVSVVEWQASDPADILAVAVDHLVATAPPKLIDWGPACTCEHPRTDRVLTDDELPTSDRPTPEPGAEATNA